MKITKWKYSKNHQTAKHNIHVLYCIELTQPKNEKNSRLKPGKLSIELSIPGISRRFSEFQALHKALTLEGYTLPPLPSTTIWSNLAIRFLPSSALEKRMKSLQRFLDEIENTPQMKASAIFQSFLGSTPDAKHGYTTLREYNLVKAERFD